MKDRRSNEQQPLSRLTPELMEAYANGTLSSQQRVRVEQFLKDNAFEAAAMEGLQAAPDNFSSDLKELEHRLAKKTHRASPALWQSYWPMAAAVSVMVIAGFLFYFLKPLDPVSSQVSIAQDSATVLAEQQVIAAPDASKKDDNGETLSSAKQPQKNKSSPIEIPDEVLTEEEPASPNISDPNIPIVNPSEADLNEKVIDPVSLGKSNQSTTIDLKESEAPSEERVSFEDAAPAVSRSQKRKQSITAVPAAANKRIQQLDLPSAKAPSKWMDYVVQNTSYPETAKNQGIIGHVQVSFTVDLNGKLADFQIITGLGYGCNEEAVRVLQEGPRWIPAKINGVHVQSRGEAEIPFPVK